MARLRGGVRLGPRLRDPPRLPGGNLAASALALGALVGLSALAERAVGRGVEPPARARAEGRGARNSLLYAATFSAFAVLLAVFAFGRVGPGHDGPGEMPTLPVPERARKRRMRKILFQKRGS